MASSRGSFLPGEPGEGRLTDEERKLVARLLYDPTYFPIEFRAWLKSFLENELFGLKKGVGDATAGGKLGLPAGMVIGWPSMTFPPDTLSCDGSVKSRTTYAKLFTILGTSWGAGDGSTTFNLPDFRDRALYGVGSRVGIAQTDGLALGSRGGPRHHHDFSATNTGSAGSHQHGAAGNHTHEPSSGSNFAITEGATAQGGTTGSFRYFISSYISSTNSPGDHQHSGVGDHQHSIPGGSTTGGYDNDEPSWAGIAWLITTGV